MGGSRSARLCREAVRASPPSPLARAGIAAVVVVDALGPHGVGFAYAFAAGRAAPELALPLAAASLAVGWSRVATRRHFPTDVLVAVVIGAVAGEVVTVAARRLRRDARDH